MTESPLILVHVEGGVADEAGARGDLAVARVGVGVSHPTVAWRKEKLYYPLEELVFYSQQRRKNTLGKKTQLQN